MFLLNILIGVHIFIWGFVLFGGFFSKDYGRANIKYIIPIVYVLHMFPYHFIVREKVRYIEKNITGMWDPKFENVKYDKDLYKDMKKYMSKEVTEETALRVIKVLKGKEQAFWIVRIFESFKLYFKDSFQNPLSPQGLLILGFILNIVSGSQL